jgi:hypothetical protein
MRNGGQSQRDLLAFLLGESASRHHDPLRGSWCVDHSVQRQFIATVDRGPVALPRKAIAMNYPI